MTVRLGGGTKPVPFLRDMRSLPTPILVSGDKNRESVWQVGGTPAILGDTGQKHTHTPTGTLDPPPQGPHGEAKGPERSGKHWRRPSTESQ